MTADPSHPVGYQDLGGGLNNYASALVLEVFANSSIQMKYKNGTSGGFTVLPLNSSLNTVNGFVQSLQVGFLPLTIRWKLTEAIHITAICDQQHPRMVQCLPEQSRQRLHSIILLPWFLWFRLFTNSLQLSSSRTWPTCISSRCRVYRSGCHTGSCVDRWRFVWIYDGWTVKTKCELLFLIFFEIWFAYVHETRTLLVMARGLWSPGTNRTL
jgi:hypothetical protein